MIGQIVIASSNVTYTKMTSTPTLCEVGQLQSNGKIEWFFQTYEKHRQRFGTLDRVFCLLQRGTAHMSLNWARLETPAEAFERLMPSPATGGDDLLATEVTVDG